MVYRFNGILLGNEKDEIMPFAAMWMELGGIMLSEISQSDIICFHSYVELDKLNRRPDRKSTRLNSSH